VISFYGTVSKAFAAKSCNVRFDRDYYLDPHRRILTDSICQKYVSEHFGEPRIIFGESNLVNWQHFSSEHYVVGGIQPNMILGMLLGAELIAYPDKDADISAGCLANCEIDDLPAPQSLLNHELIRCFDDQIREFQKSGLKFTPPFFWDGSELFAIHGPLTTAQKLMGQEVFLDMITSPERIRKILSWIMEAYIVLCEHFASIAKRTVDCIHIGECSACMVSSELFEQFIIPALSMIGGHVNRIKLHSCGSSTHLIASCAKIKNLYELDLGGETSVSKVRQIFGKDFLITIAPIPKMLMADSSLQIEQWLKRILQENAGGNMKIICHIEPDYSSKIIKELIHVIDTFTKPKVPILSAELAFNQNRTVVTK
jgi:hypothetical protein